MNRFSVFLAPREAVWFQIKHMVPLPLEVCSSSTEFVPQKHSYFLLPLGSTLSKQFTFYITLLSEPDLFDCLLSILWGLLSFSKHCI